MASANWTLLARQCDEVHNMSYLEQCQFVVGTPDCQSGDGFIPYTEVIYCSPYYPYLPLSLVLIWMVFLFGVLAITANDFLCPALVAISKKMGLSQAVAGVTFLALGNGAPDICAAFTAIQQGRSSLVISELFGAGTFVTAVVGGSIFVQCKFIVDKYSFCRDVAFYLSAAGIAFSIFRIGRVSIYHPAIFIGMYVLYIALVILRDCFFEGETGNMVNSPSSATMDFNTETEGLLPSQPFVRLRRPSGLHVHHQNAIRTLLSQSVISTNSPLPSHYRTDSICSIPGGTPQSLISRDVVYRRKSNASTSGYQSFSKEARRGSVDKMSSFSESSNELSQDIDIEDMSLLKEFWIHVMPFGWKELQEESLFMKIRTLAALPIQLILTLSVPVVDYEHEKDNWCKPLNLIHCITSPLVITTILMHSSTIYGFPVFAIAALIGLLFSFGVFLFSEKDESPTYHFAFAILAFFTGVAYIYGSCRELMALLKGTGIYFEIDESVLGLTVLAWGSSIGDLITDLSVARQGYPSMAVAAAFAGPMLNLLIGLGGSYIFVLFREPSMSLQVQFSNILYVLYAALTSSLLTTLVWLTCNGFRSSKTHGIMLYFLYAMFLVTAVGVARPDLLSVVG